MPFKKKHGDMQFSFVYFEEKVSNNLLQENYNAVMSGYVSIIIRKQLFCYFFNNSKKEIVICSNLPLIFHKNGHSLLPRGMFYLLQPKKSAHSLLNTQHTSFYATTALLNIFKNH